MNKLNILNYFITLLKKTIDITKKYSIIEIFKAFLVIFTSIILIFTIISPKSILNLYEKYTQKIHQENVEKRFEITPKINLELEKLLMKTNANRAFIIEFHNGSKSLEGLSFLFGDMTYEIVQNTEYVSQFYQNTPLSKFNIINQLKNNGYWFGTTDDLLKIDKRLSMQLQINNSQWIALILLRNQNNYLGVIGLSYCDLSKLKKEVVGCQLRTSALYLTTLLSL